MAYAWTLLELGKIFQKYDKNFVFDYYSCFCEKKKKNILGYISYVFANHIHTYILN